MAKFRVPVFGSTGKSVRVNPDATLGAQFGRTLFDEAGRVVTTASLLRRLQVSPGVGGSSGSTADHGQLTGLGDDDHTQYLRTDGTRDGGNQEFSGLTVAGNAVYDVGDFAIADYYTSAQTDTLLGLKADLTAVYTRTALDAGQLDNRYFTETEVTAALALKADLTAVYTRTALDAGQLDNRYFTETEVTAALALKADLTAVYTRTALDAGQLDTRYYTETEIDGFGFLASVVAADIDSEASTDGFVLTSDGAGNAAWEAVSGGGGVTDHGALTGLADNDHPQYARLATAETVTGAWTFSTNTAGPMVTIGDGAGADNDVLLRFNIDRPWSFRQQGTGAGAALLLYAENAGKEFRIGSAAKTTAFQFNPDTARFTTEWIKVTELLSSIRGVTGQYEDAPSAAWGGTIYGMGSSFDGGASGVDSTSVSTYGLRWLRGAHFQADSRIGEGVYVYQNGALEGGIGAGGIYSAGPMECIGNLRARGYVIIGDNTNRRIQQPTQRGTINVGGPTDDGGFGSYHGYSINNDIMFMHNGSAAGIYDEINDIWRIRFDTNQLYTDLYYSTSPIARTSSAGLTRIGRGAFPHFNSATNSSGRITTSTAAPSGTPAAGDIWIQHEA